MRIRLTLTLDVDRKRREEPPGHETFESQGSLVETLPQPRYVGFEAVDG